MARSTLGGTTQGGVHILVLTSSSSDPAYLILSGGTRTRIPDLTAQGLGLPSGRRYTWDLIGVGPYASIDAFAASAVFPREGFGFQTGASIAFTTR